LTSYLVTEITAPENCELFAHEVNFYGLNMSKSQDDTSIETFVNKGQTLDDREEQKLEISHFVRMLGKYLQITRSRGYFS
jgi:hypothetical protein